MHLRFYREMDPIGEAASFVRRIIYCDCPEPISLSVPAPPTGYNHVGWALRGAGAKVTDAGTTLVAEGDVHLAGQTVRTSAQMLLRGRVRHILAELTPTGLTAAFGCAAEPLVNKVFSSSTFGHAGVQERLRPVSPDGDMEEAIILFQRALVAEYKDAPVPLYVTAAAAAIEESQGLVPMSALLGDISERQLQRNFKRVTGCSPKYFAQLLRVNATLVSLADRRDRPLAKIAADHGFADQSHMVRAIRTFFGHAPSVIREADDLALRAFPTNGRLGAGMPRPIIGSTPVDSAA